MATQRNHLYSLGSLQLMAIIAIVLGHFWIRNTFVNSLCVSFCFVYSGYFTGRFHRFGSSYSLRDHGRFMWNKLVKLYPMHVLALAICIIALVFVGGKNTFSLNLTLIHLSLLSPWFEDSSIYFGYNPVAWWICVLFFLYLIAPLIVKGLRHMRLGWQVVLVLVLLLLEFIGGYRPSEDQPNLFFNCYHLYEFPPLRILDFTTGIVLYNITQQTWWQRLEDKLTPSRSTMIEVGAIVLFLVLSWMERAYLNVHCFRAFCTQAPSIIVLLMAFVLTSNRMGHVSRLLSIRPLVALQQYTFEIYLLQVGLYFLMEPLCKQLGIADGQHQLLYCLVQNAVLLLVAWACHHFYVKPMSRLLSIGPNKRN